MRLKTKSLTVLVAALALFLYFMLNTGGVDRGGPASGDAMASETMPEDAELLGLESTGRMEVPRIEEPPTPTPQAITPEWSGPCVVLGRVVDETGQAIVGAQVRLTGYNGWTEGLDVPRLSGRWNLHGFEIRSDAVGGFRFEVPVPTVQATSVKIVADRFHDSAWLRFTSVGGGGALPPLAKGVRNLGEIQLVNTGALKGRVTDTFGQPLADVNIGIGPTENTTYGKDAWTGSDGVFLLGHAPEGTYGASARKEGFLGAFLQPVTVTPGQDTTGINFVLQAAPTIEGWVTDENGRPLQGVKVGGWPVKAGSYARALSDAEGHFIIYLPQEQRLSLAAELEGFALWGDEHDNSKSHAPGTKDLRITLQSVRRTRFLVLDAESGDPIERFGLNVHKGEGSEAKSGRFTERRRPRVQEHAEGTALATVREGFDLFLIAAEGYPLATGDVRWDSPGEPLQTVRLKKGASVKGRVLQDGQPLVGVLVQIAGGSPNWAQLTKADMEAVQLTGKMPEPTGFREDSNRRNSTQTDGQGRFELYGLAGGLHRLKVLPSDGAPLIVKPWTVKPQGMQDLGDLHMLMGAALTGSVLLPSGVDPAGLSVTLGDLRGGVNALVDDAGRFSFENQAAGQQRVTLGGRPGELDDGATVSVELVPGGSQEVQIDARDFGMCWVSLVIEFPGRNVEGGYIFLRSPKDTGSNSAIGKCDATGKVEAHVRAGRRVQVQFWTSGGSITHPSAWLDLTSGGQVHETLRFEMASLVLELPSEQLLPQTGTITLTLESTDASQSPHVVQKFLVDGALSSPRDEFAQIAESKVSLQGLPPGQYTLKFEMANSVEEDMRVGTPGVTYRSVNGRFFTDQDPHFTATQAIALQPNKELRVSLE